MGISSEGLALATLVARGLGAKEAAAKLGITPDSARNRLRTLRHRFGCKTTAQLIGILVIQRLIPPPSTPGFPLPPGVK